MTDKGINAYTAHKNLLPNAVHIQFFSYLPGTFGPSIHPYNSSL